MSTFYVFDVTFLLLYISFNFMAISSPFQLPLLKKKIRIKSSLCFVPTKPDDRDLNIIFFQSRRIIRNRHRLGTPALINKNQPKLNLYIKQHLVRVIY